MNTLDIAAALEPLVAALESLSVAYQVGGSIASSVFGAPRATLDVDLVAELKATHARPLVHALESRYYIDEDMILEAVRRRASFNVIHLDTALKLDVFVVKMRPFDREAFTRGIDDTLPTPDGETRSFRFTAPEDIILHKLEWYRLGNEISERQWLDVLGVLKVQAGALDTAYLDRWAEALGLTDLLERARDDAGR